MRRGAYMNRVRVSLGMITAGVVAACLSGCRPTVSDPPSVYELPKCAEQSEPFPVKELKDRERFDCDLVGQDVVFPNGKRLPAPPGGATDGYFTGLRGYYLFNYGEYGVVAGTIKEGDEHPTWFGTKDGLDRYVGKLGEELFTTRGLTTER